MRKPLKPCPDCGAPIGEHHRDECDVEFCRIAVGQHRTACTFTPMTRDGKCGPAVAGLLVRSFEKAGRLCYETVGGTGAE